MNNIQKAFKTKSKLRGMADGGQAPRPEMLGTGAARQAADHLVQRRGKIDAALDEALGAPAPRPAPTNAAPAPAKKPKEKSALRSFFGLADGGSPADVDRIMNSRDMSIFSPQEMKQFNAMGQAAMADAAQMQDVGVQAGQAALSAARPAELPAVGTDDMAPPELELADGGKVKGKGGPTDDKVGPVALSDGEYVLPADTVEIVGRENLDALRLATHDFVDDDNKPKVSGLRKMANGGTFYVDPDGVASRSLPRTQLPVPAAPRPPLEGTATRLPPPTATAGGSPTSSLRAAANTGGGRLGAAARGALPLAAIAGAAESYGDASTGYRQQFADSVGGGKSVAGSLGADALRTLGAVGNTITFGAGERVGRGLSNLTSGGSFVDGLMQTPDREAFAQRETQRVMSAPPAAPAAAPAGVDETVRGMDTSLGNLRLGRDPGNGFTQDARFSGQGYSVYGRANPNAGKPGESATQYVGLGTPSAPEDPIMGELRSALRSIGQNGGGGGFSRRTGNERDINARYDKLASQLSSMYGPKGQGNLARRLLELEQSRSGALDADARNQSALRGQDVQASTAANTANMQARMQALQTLGSMANQRSQQGAQAQAAQLKALQEAQAAARQGEEKGFERYTSAIGSMFVGPDGKPDAAEQERFTSFLQASDPQAQQKFAAMSPQDQMVLLQNFKTLYDMQKARNATAESGGGAITNRADMPVDVREATWNDYWNNNLPLGDYVWSNVPFTNPNVVVTESGQPTLMSDYATTDGNWDADKLEMIRQRTGKDREGRSALRGN